MSMLNGTLIPKVFTAHKNKTQDYYDKLKVDIKTIVGLYILVLAACLIGNILVCTTVMKSTEMRRKRWYYFVVNLSIADMGFALITPLHLVQVAGVNVGTAGCKIGIHTIDTFMLTSVFTLAYISVDRYLCICHPKVSYVRKVHPVWIIAAIWTSSILFLMPFSVFCKSNKENGGNSCDCNSAWPSRSHQTIFKFTLVIVGFYVPFLTMLFSYSQICIFLWGTKDGRRSIDNDKSGIIKRSVKMMIMATLLFSICWLPVTVIYLMKQMKAGNPSVLGKLYLFIQVLAFSNSAWNPFTYCIFSKEFRKGFKKILCWRNDITTKERSELKRKDNACFANAGFANTGFANAGFANAGFVNAGTDNTHDSKDNARGTATTGICSEDTVGSTNNVPIQAQIHL